MRALIATTVAVLAASAAAPAAAQSYGNTYGHGDGGVIRCESSDGRTRECATGGGRVVLERQHSRAACIEGRTWGYGRDGIWVSDGCRADFRVFGDGDRYGGYDNYGGYDDYGYGSTGARNWFASSRARPASRAAPGAPIAAVCGCRRAAAPNSRWIAVATTAAGTIRATVTTTSCSVASPTMAASASAWPIPVQACNWCASCRGQHASRAAPGAMAATGSGFRRGAARNSAPTDCAKRDSRAGAHVAPVLFGDGG